MAVYFFYGDEDYNIELEIEKMRSRLNPDFLSMSFQTLDNPDYQTLINTLRTPPMMFGEMLVIINAEAYFLSNKNYFDDKELEDIEPEEEPDDSELDAIEFDEYTGYDEN